jgi:hypothetical protein
MRIRFLVAIASEDWAHRPGEISYVERDLAEKWVGAGIAVAVPIVATAVKEQAIDE